MGDQNTYPCRGCGKPYLEASARNIHESGCHLVNDDDLDDRTSDDSTEEEPEEASDDHTEEHTEEASQETVKDQDQQFETPPEPDPEPDPGASHLGEAPEEPDPKPTVSEPGTCQCCGSDVGNITRKGMCWGCDLAGCGKDSQCKHQTVEQHSA